MQSVLMRYDRRNTGDGEASYLIVQGVGVYDRIPAPPADEA